MTTNSEKLGFNEPHQYNIEELIALKDEQLERQKSASVVNKFTGEVRRFRSMANPGNYHDATINTEESVTDTSDYEPLETTIERCSRSGYLREYMAKMKAYDEANASDENPNDFNFEPSPVETPGFDLSDAKELETQIIKDINQTSIPESEAKKSEVTNEPANAEQALNEPSAPVE